MGLLCPLRATPCCPEFNLSDGEEEGVVVVEEAEDDVVCIGRMTNLLDLQEQQETSICASNQHILNPIFQYFWSKFEICPYKCIVSLKPHPWIHSTGCITSPARRERVWYTCHTLLVLISKSCRTNQLLQRHSASLFLNKSLSHSQES